MKSICVFMSANLGKTPAYWEVTKKLGLELASKSFQLIYGGSRTGLMGMLADTVLKSGGRVTGVMSKVLPGEETHLGLTHLHTVESMQQRKKLMGELADGFIIMPGGLGTLEEFFEFWNAAKLGLHDKPIVLFNIENYFNKFLEFIDHAVTEHFLQPVHRNILKVSNDPCQLLDVMFKQ